MKDLNMCIFVGRLTRDGELKYTTGGVPIVNFSIASNRRVKNGDNWEDAASFFDVTLFGKLGESIAQYLTKGSQVAIEGELRQDRWQDKEGANRSKLFIVADTVQLLGGRQRGEGPLAEPEPVTREAAHEGSFADSIPF